MHLCGSLRSEREVPGLFLTSSVLCIYGDKDKSTERLSLSQDGIKVVEGHKHDALSLCLSQCSVSMAFWGLLF